jgi:hypothetical protein
MGSRGTRIGAATFVLAFAFAFALPVRAEPSASEKETARALMDEGHARRDARDHVAALAQFEGADAIMHVPTTGLEVAREQIALGRLVEARDTLERVTRSAPTPNEPDAFRLARKTADALDQEIAARIPSLRITETGAPSDATTVVTVDGVNMPIAALIAPIKVNPGHHVVNATAGSVSVRKEVDVAEGQTAAVSLTLTGSSAPAGTPPAAPGDAAPASTSSGSTAPASVPWLRWGGAGLAGVGAVVGVITGAMSLSSANTASKGCVNDRCPPATWADIDAAHTTGTISTVAFVAAGVGAVLFATSFAIGSPHPQTAGKGGPPPRRQITAGLGLGGAWAGGTF